jgi:hypothetical protein
LGNIEADVELMKDQAARDAKRISDLEGLVAENRTIAEQNMAALRQDLLAEIRRAGSSGAAASSGHAKTGGWGGIPQAGGYPALAGRTPFVADRVFVKGCCPWGRDDEFALCKQDATTLAQMIMQLLPADLQAKVRMPTFLFRKNRQITLPLRNLPSRDEVADLVETGNKELQARNIQWNGQAVWIQADAPEYVKLRRRCLAKAMNCIRNECTMNDRVLEPDWPSGTLYVAFQGCEIEVGKVTKVGDWQWKEAGLQKVWPKVALATLVASFEAS